MPLTAFTIPNIHIRKAQFYIIALCCFVLFGCRQEDEISSEEAIVQYKNIQELHRKSNQDKNREAWLEYAFECSQLIPKITTDHELVLSYFHHTGYQYRVYELFGESLKMYKGFFKYYDTHESEFSDELKEEFERKRTFNYRGAAIAYEQLGLPDSAYLEHQKNLAFVKSLENVFKPAAHNDFGMFLVGSLKDTTEALKQFEEAFTYTAENFPEHDLIGSIRNNIGGIYFNQNRLEEAYDLFYTNYFFYKENRGSKDHYFYETKALVSAVKILEILRIQNSIKALDKFYTEVKRFYDTLHPDLKNDPKTAIEFQQVELQYLLAHKDFKKSYQLLEKIKTKSDSLNISALTARADLQAKMNDVTLDNIQSKYRLEQKQKETELLNQRLIIWLISIFSIVVLLGLSFAYYRRQQQAIHAGNKQRIAEQDLEIASIRNKQLNLEIESKKRDLTDFAINLTQNQEWAKVLASKLDHLKDTKGRERKNLMDEFEEEIRKKTTFDTDTKIFFERLDKLSDSFYSHLNAEFPDLSKTEKRLCSLIRLKMDSEHIATIQNITLASLNTSRYRLRKKLNLSKEVDLDSFIQSL